MAQPLAILERPVLPRPAGSDGEQPPPPTAAPHRARAERAAEQTGVGTDRIARHEFDLSHYTEEGVFGNVDTGGFGALYRQLDWRELGVVLPPTTIDIRASRIALLPNKHR